MVEIEFNGSNIITFGKYKIAKGINLIESEDFNNLMLLPNFAYRVNNNIFNVIKKNSFETIKVDLEEEKKQLEKVYVSDLIEEIKKMDNLEKLYELLDTDKRTRIQKAVIERIEQIG